MFQNLLIANRGEVAIRVARSAAALGIRTVAVHTRDDANCLHVRSADRAVLLPGQGPRGYLDGAAIIDAARAEGCDAIHPGYGFLSEDADFAKACAEAGLALVGPGADLLQALGDKLSARALAERAGVPVLRATGALTDLDGPDVFMDAIQGPIMLKSASGGGGRGMRRVQDRSELPRAFAACSAEADALGGGALFAEELFEAARHVEVQLLGDGIDVTHLWERDCSLQRRNQKLLEFAPAPGLDADKRANIIEAALALGRTCSLRGLATAEFLVSKDRIAFIEVNPRLQVEHTVTEEITGFDLVELQLRLAAGERLSQIDPSLIDPPVPRGIAVQARVNAERVTRQSITPASGTISGFQCPAGRGVRIETHGYAGYELHPGFDPLLAKIILHEPRADPARLLVRLGQSLAETSIDGITTNLPLLLALARHPALGAWDVTTGLIDAVLPDLELPDEGRSATHDGETRGRVTSPMQGQLKAVLVSVDEVFHAGQELALVEAMKMEHVVTAEQAGRVIGLTAAVGELVAEGGTLLTYEPEETGEGAETEDTRPDPETIRADLAALQDRLSQTLDAARPAAIERRKKRGQRTTRELIEVLCEGGDFHEYGQLVLAAQRRKLGVERLVRETPADGIITGIGSVNRPVFGEERAQTAILAYDATVMAGTQGMKGHKKTDRLLEKAHDLGLPTIFLTEGGGGRPNDDDLSGLVHCALDIETFATFAGLRGRGPKITVNSGFCFAGNAALFGAGDLRIAARDSWIGLGGPAMIEAGGLGTFDPREIGPATMQAEQGLVDILCDSDQEAVKTARRALSYFQGVAEAWSAANPRHLRHVVPENRQRSYPMRDAIKALFDTASFLETGAAHAPGIVTGFARVEGHPVAVMANNPHHLGGALDAQASAKGARFMRLADRFGLPLVSLCDTPGFMVGPDSERQGGVAAACDFLSAGAVFRPPILFFCLRKGYGIGAQAMAGGSFARPTFTLSWPTGEFGAMGLEGGVQLGYKKELEAEPDADARQALYDRLVAEAYAQGGALNVASLGEIDAVIDPADTRSWIMRGIRVHRAKS
ncbi:carboxyl transferase domain-containing protein [Lutimaribacter marinistellae]|uniref:Carboxyl transferase domain-containing protein n=1 Tax=Lutimaribacter marinistellae TaxID=1820329 RepID=A0ABV7THD9_9RHOB